MKMLNMQQNEVNLENKVSQLEDWLQEVHK